MKINGEIVMLEKAPSNAVKLMPKLEENNF